MPTDPLLKTAQELTSKLKFAKKQEIKRIRSLANKAKELKQKVDEFESTRNLLDNA